MTARSSTSDSIPDYGWEDSGGEHSHSYLDDVVFAALRDAALALHRDVSELRVFDAGKIGSAGFCL